MAPPNYFFPRVAQHQLVQHDKLSPAVLRPRGLEATFADVTSVERDTTAVDLAGAGPGGQGGCLLCAQRTDGQKPPRVGQYKPDHQRWTRFGDGDTEYWVGIDKHLPPGPDDLVRKGPNPFGRHYWADLAGAKWLIPVIRDVEGGTGLPQDWHLDADGSVSYVTQATYRALWEEFAAVVELVFDPERQNAAGTFALEAPEIMKRCLEGLSLRYRVGRAEINLLGLITSQTWFDVLAFLVDLPLFWDVWRAGQPEGKKNGSAPLDGVPKDESPPTGPGGPASDPTAAPHGASSSC